jgi:hypothetical protein
MLSRLILSKLELEGPPESEELEPEPESEPELFFFETTRATGMMIASSTTKATKHPITMRFFLDQFDQNFQAGGPPPPEKLPSQLSSSFQWSSGGAPPPR